MFLLTRTKNFFYEISLCTRYKYFYIYNIVQFINVWIKILNSIIIIQVTPWITTDFQLRLTIKNYVYLGLLFRFLTFCRYSSLGVSVVFVTPHLKTPTHFHAHFPVPPPPLFIGCFVFTFARTFSWRQLDSFWAVYSRAC